MYEKVFSWNNWIELVEQERSKNQFWGTPQNVDAEIVLYSIW